MPDNAATEIDKHEELWFEDGNLVLLVDGVYFKVHRDVLARSCGLIKDMLSIPQEEQPVEGSAIEHPVPIHAVAFDDIEIIIRDAYSKTFHSGLAEKRGAAGVVRLVRAAHRVQSWNVAIAAATAAMKLLTAEARLKLCQELDLDSIREAAEEEQQQEELQRVEAYNKRAVGRGLPACSLPARNANRVKNLWLNTAISDVAHSTSFALPLAQFDDKLNLKLALARIAITEERRRRFLELVERYRGDLFGTAEVSAALAGLDIHAGNFDAWYNELSSQGHGVNISTSDVKSALLTEEESKEIVLKLCSQLG